MSIVSSVFALIGPSQIDGRQFVRETHTDNIALTHVVEYLSRSTDNRTAIMNARAVLIAEQIAQSEFDAAVLVDARPTLNYNTVAQFVARFRTAYKGDVQDAAVKLSWWLINRINAGDVTDAQVQTAFGLTSGQYTTLKTNFLIPQHDTWAAVLAAAGQ